MTYLGSFGYNLKTIFPYLKLIPHIGLIAKFCEETKVHKFGFTNA